jgi:hypothetical protein
MTDSTYRVVFSGNALPGTDRDTAISNFAQLFKKTPEQVAGLFSGKPSVIKKGVSEAEAQKYCRALEKAGLAVSAEAEAPAALQAADVAPPAPAGQPEESPAPAAPRIPPTLALVEDDEQGNDDEDGTRERMTCPACGHEQPKADICERCDVVIEKFLQRQAEKQQEQGMQGNLWPDAPDADEPAEGSGDTAEKAPSFFARLLAKFRRS